MESGDLICLASGLLAFYSIFACRCYQKTKATVIVAWCLFGATIAPFLLKDRFDLTVFYVGFVLGLLSYFEFSYEGRLRALGKDANEFSEYPHQLRLLPLFADKFSEKLRGTQFYFYSPKVGQASLVAFALRDDSFFIDLHVNDAFIQAFRFIHDDIAEKWGEPSRGHSLSLLIERINRNALLYLKTSRVGNMADIRDAAKQNLQCLLAIYYHDFHLKGPLEAELKTPEAFSCLRWKFENVLEKFPVRLELA